MSGICGSGAVLFFPAAAIVGGKGIDKGVGKGLDKGVGKGFGAGVGKGLDKGVGKGLSKGVKGRGLDKGVGKGLDKGSGLDKGFGKGLDSGGGGSGLATDEPPEPCPEHLLPAVRRNCNYMTVGISSDVTSAVRRATEQQANN